MKTIMGKVSIAVRKHKNGGKVYKARDIKGPGGVDKLVQFDDGYQVLIELRGSPPHWERSQKFLFTMIRQLGSANLFITLSAAETRWKHLLKNSVQCT